MVFKFEVFKNHKLDKIYVTEISRTECIQVIDKYWDKGDKT